MGARDLVELFVDEEKFVQEALRDTIVDLAKAIEMVSGALRKGGRLFYVGAGTSGRLGVLDASEIPPTFGASPELVQGIIAGGARALYRSIEGAEDEENLGRLAVVERGVKDLDVVMGISASGRTPFVRAALSRAKSLGAKTIFLTCNPVSVASGVSAADAGETAAATANVDVDLAIQLAVGPEILTGSTRLKAGTATKVALNIISTGAMVLLGKVRGNLMIDLHASSAKLRDRAVRLVAELANCGAQVARQRLETSGWDLRAVLNHGAK
jgi:N-acetylmuramic acid 6-phosphate etherase